MAAKTEFRLLMSALSHTVYAGRVKRVSDSTVVSTGVRHDVTSDFLDLVVRFGEAKGGAFEIVGDETWDVTVTKRAAAQGGRDGA